MNFEILTPINAPRAIDKKAWSSINESFTKLHDLNPIYRLNDPPGIKLNKLNTFTSSFFEIEYGCKRSKPKADKQHARDPEKKKLRQLERELRKEWKNNKDSNCVEWKNNKDSNCVGDLRKQLFQSDKVA